jgi:predicted nucleic acid-binding protein
MTTHPILVPDASVLLKWVLESDDEQDRDRALEIREAWLSGRCAIMLPSLWFFEVGNILGMKQPGLAAQLMQRLTGYRFEQESPEAIYEKAFELMKTFKVTFYDAAYHAVAIKRSGMMITADDAYYQKTSRVGHVAVLGNWSSRLGVTRPSPNR